MHLYSTYRFEDIGVLMAAQED